jgi:DNA-binding CsgD family transcriptional regulator
MGQEPNPLDLLTAKEREALDLVLDRLSSKEIAQRLGGLSPKTIDQRLDGARAKLGAATRVEAARRYASLLGTPERFPYQPFPIPKGDSGSPMSGGIPAEAVYTLGDALTFGSSAPWEETESDWGAPKFRGHAVGTVPLLVLILAGAALLLALVLLGLGVMQGLNALVSS